MNWLNKPPSLPSPGTVRPPTPLRKAKTCQAKLVRVMPIQVHVPKAVPGAAPWLSNQRNTSPTRTEGVVGAGVTSKDDAQRISSWLSTMDIAAIRTKISTRVSASRIKRTGDRVVRTDGFQEWIKQRGRTLCVTGPSGAGHTVLATAVINYLQHLAKNFNNVSVAYVYCNHSGPSSITEILLSFIKQQLDERPENLLPTVLPLYVLHQQNDTVPSFLELVQVLKQISQTSPTNFYVLDGVPDHDSDAFTNLINALTSLNVNSFLLPQTDRLVPQLHHLVPALLSIEATIEEGDINIMLKELYVRSPDLEAWLANEYGPKHTLAETLQVLLFADFSGLRGRAVRIP
ncbi:hypothetical protein FA15DRAFT_176700 [Coprinopsis marcescibilis]|uniref:Nephrocystin 3-like N-terminal domain-containing protein n=1 Tax=Coprinopsis marcescibilis TaxID=230819 RepID=A0A5C3KGR7_COPMA|nr:hypothetical protein FA15DRAFT_176700 [Coprinopsis marcescibilis]